MTSPTDVDQLIQQTRRYEFADGLRDFQLAVLLGFGGVTSWLAFEPFWTMIVSNAAMTFGRWAALIGMLPVLLLVLIVWGMLWVMKRIRQRWLWRESGMVTATRWMIPRKVNLISFSIILGGLALAFGARLLGWAGDSFLLRMLWAATGWSFGYTLVELSKQTGLPRYIRLGVVGGLLSTIILFLPLTFGQSSLVFGSIWFVLLVISGISAFRNALANMNRGD